MKIEHLLFFTLTFCAMPLPHDLSEARFQRTFEADAIINNTYELKIYLAGLRHDPHIPEADIDSIASYCLQWLAGLHESCAGNFLWVQYTNTKSAAKPTTIKLNWAKAKVLDAEFDKFYGYEVGTVSCFEHF